MERLRMALIGCGKVGHTHAAALNTLPESELVAVCDADPDRAGVFAVRYGACAYTDVGAMLAGSDVHAVTITTPHPFHAGATIMAAGPT